MVGFFKKFWLLISLPLLFGALSACSSVGVLLQTAPDAPTGPVAVPVVVSANLADWQTTEKPQIKALLETHVYGMFPQNLQLKQTEHRALDGLQFNQSATIELETLEIRNPDTGAKRAFNLVIVRPINAPQDVPVIMVQSFCPNAAVIPVAGIPQPQNGLMSCEKSMFSGVFTFAFGRYIAAPPTKDIIQRGYALAAVFAADFIPNSAKYGEPIINQFFAEQDPAKRTHAVMAWAAEFSLLSRYLKSEKGFSKTIAYGHSRFGKSALVAAAYDQSIDGVVAHQSGTGGASLSKDKNGESIGSITKTYPHWFVEKFAEYADNEADLPLDQHFLLALIAPKPVLLGNARRDVWSDPNGAFRAAQAASLVYQLYGKSGLRQQSLNDYDPGADIAFWLRPGTHGVVKEDWPAFLDFLDAHFK
ncbi:putative acetyl xylan esterase [hydrothermal vent metagenome]|uniref:Putative acetyl xylan esterase n=1 Tax=hydrothermal vent metagenome TaxID=652676 RepID=A0A3B0S3X7_9ZZZZ